MVSLQKILCMYILIPSLHRWKNGAVPAVAQFVGSAGFGTLLPSLDVPACLLGGAQPCMNSAVVFHGLRGGSYRAVCWDELVQPRRLGGAGWVALWPQSPAQCGRSQGSVRLHTCAPIATPWWPHVGTWGSAPQLHGKTLFHCCLFVLVSRAASFSAEKQVQPSVRFQLFGCINSVPRVWHKRQRSAALHLILLSLPQSLWRVLWSASFLPPKQVTC